jgi:hypothetical protein
MITFKKIKLNQRRLGWKRITAKTLRRFMYWDRQMARLEKRGLVRWIGGERQAYEKS